MYGSAEHRVDMHNLARARVNRGLPVWAETLDLSAVFHDESLSFEEKRDRIVAAVKATRFYQKAQKEEEFDDEDVLLCMENIEESKTPAEFDKQWAWFYDLADNARLWIKTH